MLLDIPSVPSASPSPPIASLLSSIFNMPTLAPNCLGHDQPHPPPEEVNPVEEFNIHPIEYGNTAKLCVFTEKRSNMQKTDKGKKSYLDR